jgi:hypothetical protein
VKTRTCPECGDAFQARAEHQRFCSSRCRVRHHRGDAAGDASQDRLRADVAVRTRSVERAITALADTASELPVDAWADVWAGVGRHMRNEFARVGRSKS